MMYISKNNLWFSILIIPIFHHSEAQAAYKSGTLFGSFLWLLFDIPLGLNLWK